MLFNRNATTYTPSAEFSALVNHEMQTDGRFHPNLGGITQGGMANHYPMTVMSLAALGGSDEDIHRFKSSWRDYRAPIWEMGLADTKQIHWENWTDFLGRSEYLIEFRRLFLDEIQHIGVQQVVDNALGTMADALPMGLFHPLIRLSFAKMHGDEGLIADALAYFAIRYADLYQTDVDNVNVDIVNAEGRDGKTSDVRLTPQVLWRGLYSLQQDGEMNLSVRGPSLPVAEQLCREPALHNLSGALSLTTETLSSDVPEIIRLAVALYLYEPALTTLHAVTAAQALADLSHDWGKQSETYVRLWRRYWIWLTGLYIEKGVPLLEVQGDLAADADSWQPLIARARRSNEVHSIKMVFSCRWLAEHHGEHPIYQAAAMQALSDG